MYMILYDAHVLFHSCLQPGHSQLTHAIRAQVRTAPAEKAQIWLAERYRLLKGASIYKQGKMLQPSNRLSNQGMLGVLCTG